MAASSVLRSQGVKGSDVYSSTGDPRVDLSVMLVRGLGSESIQSGLDRILALGTSQAEEDAFLLAFQTRAIRGGKGERDLGKTMFLHLLDRRPELTFSVLDVLPQYGRWGDLFDLLSEVSALPTTEATTTATSRLYDIAVQQIRKDDATPEGSPISLCAKWAPREDRLGEQAKELAKRLFPSITKFSSRMKAYRKKVAGLNRRLQTTEIKMCGHTWSAIEPRTVPGRCLHKCKKAFLNEPLPPRKGRKARQDRTALRHPTDTDRMTCREHFTDFFAKAAKGEAKVHGADTVYPHEVLKDVLRLLHEEEREAVKAARAEYTYDSDSDAETSSCGCGFSEYERRAAPPVTLDLSSLLPSEGGAAAAAPAPAAVPVSLGERDLLRAQWRVLVEKAAAAGALKNSIAMCDFSGSMDGLPKIICTALGMLVAKVNGTRKILTFDSTPTWHEFPASDDVFDWARSIGPNLAQGMSTDFQAAMEMILADIKQRRVRPEDLPRDLIVFTDMGWDDACDSSRSSYYTGNTYRHNVKTVPWQTHLEMIRENFRRAGEDMWGVPFVPPRIVVWNLRADYKDFHATADQDGVVMLSGWSPALFKVLQDGPVAVATPYEALRAQLDDPLYDSVRQRIRAVPVAIPALPAFSPA